MGERLGTQSVDRKAGGEGHRARPKEAASLRERQEAGGPKSDCVSRLCPGLSVSQTLGVPPGRDWPQGYLVETLWRPFSDLTL